MSRTHPREVELARAGGDGVAKDVIEHAHRCARCRSTVADYRWLESRVEAVLKAVAGTVPVPHSGWQAVRGRISVDQQRLVTSRRLSVAASVVLAACVMLAAAPIPDMAVGTMQTLLPRAALVPSQRFSERCSAAMTPTPASPGGVDLTPPLWPPPTQPEPDTLRP